VDREKLQANNMQTLLVSSGLYNLTVNPYYSQAIVRKCTITCICIINVSDSLRMTIFSR